MHVPAVPLFRDATGMAVALTAWARHRCLQLYFTLFYSVAILILSYYDSRVTKVQVSSFKQYQIFKYRP